VHASAHHGALTSPHRCCGSWGLRAAGWCSEYEIRLIWCASTSSTECLVDCECLIACEHLPDWASVVLIWQEEHKKLAKLIVNGANPISDEDEARIRKVLIASLIASLSAC